MAQQLGANALKEKNLADFKTATDAELGAKLNDLNAFGLVDAYGGEAEASTEGIGCAEFGE